MWSLIIGCGRFPAPVPQLKPEHFFFLSAFYCVTEGYPSCPCPKELVAILILSGSGHENLFGRMWSLMLSAWTQNPDLLLLSIVTDLCICTEYMKHTKCFISLPKSQDLAWNHLFFTSVNFYLLIFLQDWNFGFQAWSCQLCQQSLLLNSFSWVESAHLQWFIFYCRIFIFVIVPFKGKAKSSWQRSGTF